MPMGKLQEMTAKRFTLTATLAIAPVGTILRFDAQTHPETVYRAARRVSRRIRLSTKTHELEVLE